jgi:heme A synthase
VLTVLIAKWRKEKRLLVPGIWLGVFLLVQVGLGVHIIILERPAFITTSHVMVGAVVLATSFLLIVRARRLIK